MNENKTHADSKTDSELIRLLNVKDAYTKCYPRSDCNRAFVKMQLQIAKIIASDAYKEQMKTPTRNFNYIVDRLTEIWKDNIKSMALALILTKKD